MNRLHTAGLLTLMLACALLTSCGSSRRGAPLYMALVPTDSALAHGEQVFMRYCNGCHPGGRGGLGPGINNKPLPGFLVRFQVRNGLGVMPAFGNDVIPHEDLDSLVLYVKALRAQKN